LIQESGETACRVPKPNPSLLSRPESLPSSPNESRFSAIDRLIPFARNPRTHSDARVARIAASIVEFGFNNPILVDTKDGIIAGRKLSPAEVPVIVLDHLTEAQGRAYLMGWDEELLGLELAELRAQDFWGSATRSEALLAATRECREGLTDGDACPEPLKQAVSRRGASGCWAITGSCVEMRPSRRTWTAWWRAGPSPWSTPIHQLPRAVSSNFYVESNPLFLRRAQHHIRRHSILHGDSNGLVKRYLLR
jgi:hypothetical protein